MPKSATLGRAVETATKWWATASVFAASDPSMAPDASSPAHSQSRARRALVRVSSVVKVFEATMKSVVSGSSPLVFWAMSVGSMFETNRAWMPASAYGSSAAEIMTGPRSEPPMPMLTTWVTFLPVTPFHSPLRTRSAKAAMRESTSCTSSSTFCPSTTSAGSAPAGRRRAVCSTARSSVVLMCSPARIAA